MMWTPTAPPLPAMSEETRKRKLARARKKTSLRSRSPGTSVLVGTCSSPEDTPPPRESAPGVSIQDILKELVSSLSCSNGVVLTPLDKWQKLDEHGIISKDENQSLSSTESLRQISQQLTGLVSQDTKELELFAKEKGCLRQQLEVHIQTIGILLSEKSDLRSALFHTQNAVEARTGELEDITSHLKASQQRVEELENVLCTVSKEKEILDKSSPSDTSESSDQKEKVERETEQVQTLKEEKAQAFGRVQELEACLATLKNERELSKEQDLQVEVDNLRLLLQHQSKDYETLIFQYEQREQRLRELEHIAEKWDDHRGARAKILERMENDQTTIRLALSQNQELKSQLTEMQDAFVRLTNENLDLTCSVQAEIHNKNQLMKELEELNENLGEMKSMVEVKKQQAETLQEQRDLLYGHLQQHIAAYQPYELLKYSQEENLQLHAQLSRLTALHKEGPVVEDEERCEDVGSNALMMIAGKEEPPLGGELAHLELTSTQNETPASKTGEDSVPAETYCLLKESMENLQGRFSEVMKEKVDLEERLAQVEHRCAQLSMETDTTSQYVAVYQNQRALPRDQHRAEEECSSHLAQNKELTVKLLELEDLVLKFMEKKDEDKKPGLSPRTPETSERTTEPSVSREWGLASSEALQDVSPRGADGEQAATKTTTAQQILELLHDLQRPEHQPVLGENVCLPFFYHPDANNEVKILVI
ncbi:golgin subfamily A member 2 [Rhynchocyon petersi]